MYIIDGNCALEQEIKEQQPKRVKKIKHKNKLQKFLDNEYFNAICFVFCIASIVLLYFILAPFY